jgi:lysophospholipase L1-like esterase
MHKNLAYILLVSLLLLIVILVVLPKKSPETKEGTTAKNTGDEESTIQYMALGDSYTIGEGVRERDRFPNQLTSLLRDKGYSIELIENPSRTGYTTLDLIEREIPILKKNNVNLISILIGVNDQVQGVDAETFRTRFVSVLSKVISTKPEARVFVLTIPNYTLTPQGKNFGNAQRNTATLNQYNQIIIEESQKLSLPVVDISELSDRVATDSKLTTTDGLHPSGTHYTLWVERLLPTIEGLLQAR